MNDITPPTPASMKSLRSLLIAVIIAQFLLPFMVTGVTPLLPLIGKDLDASAAELSLVITVYSLSLAIMNLMAGRIGDMLGRKRIFLTGLAIFSGSVAILPFLPTIELFLVFRFIQATGTAMMNTCALAILVASAPPSMRGRVLGISSIGMFVGLSIGPTIAGFVAALFAWQAMFLGLLPLCIFAWLVMFHTVKEEWYDAPNDPFDWKGSFFYVLGIVAFTLGSIWILEGWWAILLTFSGFGFLAIFICVEQHVRHPLLDISLLRNNLAFSLSALTIFINFSSLFGMVFYMSLYMQTIHGMSIINAGLFLSVGAVTQVLLSTASGNLGDRFGAPRVSSIGMLLCGSMLWILAGIDADTSYALLIFIQISLAIGSNLFNIPITSDIMGSVDTAHLGQASGLVGTVRTLGMLTSMMIITLSMNLYLGSEALGPNNIDQFLAAMHMNFYVFAILNGIGLCICFIRLRLDRKTS